MIVITQTIGMIILGILFLGAVGSAGFLMYTSCKNNDYNPNAKHYCAWCRKLEWECDCPDC